MSVMPDDDDDDKMRRAFEEARDRDFPEESEAPPPSAPKKPAGDAAKQPPQENGKGDGHPSLRPIAVLPEPWHAPNWLPTGEAVVMEFVRRHGEDFYHATEEGSDYHWNGKIWERDQCCTLANTFAELCRAIGAAKANKKTIRGHVESASFIGGGTRRAREMLSGPFDRLNREPVLSTPGGRVMLSLDVAARAWHVEAHDRNDYCTKLAAVTPKRGPCPLWLTSLRRWMADDNDMIDYLQRLGGYCASPYTSDQIFAFFFGPGGSGKGTFLRVLRRVLGTYAMVASLDMFLATKFEQHPEELAQLPGVWFVMATEAEKGKSWNEAKIKAITGGDPMRARHMRKDSFEFQPKCKVIPSGNDAPAVKGVDSAMKRRLQIVPFTVPIPEAERDGTLEDRLVNEEGAQILAWFLDGFEQWREHGLCPPDKVIAASEEYFEEQDDTGQFLDEECDVGGYQEFCTEAYRRWQTFATARGYYVGSQKRFVQEMVKKGMQRDRTSKARILIGFRLKKMNRSDDNDV